MPMTSGVVFFFGGGADGPGMGGAVTGPGAAEGTVAYGEEPEAAVLPAKGAEAEPPPLAGASGTWGQGIPHTGQKSAPPGSWFPHL